MDAYDMIACACGCGSTLAATDARGRGRAFMHGHNSRGVVRPYAPRPWVAARNRRYLSRPAAERFAGKIEPEPNSGCHIWVGATTNTGYGTFWDGTRTVFAHRYILEAETGPLAAGEQALHHCDFRRCVNRDHIFRGTAADNVADMVAKGRHWRNVWKRVN